MSAAQDVANAIEAALYACGHEEVLVEEDARHEPSVFRVEIPWLDETTYHAIIATASTPEHRVMAVPCYEPPSEGTRYSCTALAVCSWELFVPDTASVAENTAGFEQAVAHAQTGGA